MNLNDIFKYFQEPKNAFVVGMFLSILVLLLALNIFKNKRIKRSLADFDMHYNELKAVKLSYYLQKTKALAKSNSDVAKIIPKCEEEFNKVQEAFVEISAIVAEADDLVFMHKPKRALAKVIEGEEKINRISSSVEALEEFMEQILKNESKQREVITSLKEFYRTIKNDYNACSAEIGIINDYYEIECLKIEEMFTCFEEQLYGTLFDAAKQTTNEISICLNHLNGLVKHSPMIIETAQGKIISMCNDISNIFLQARELGVVLNHLEIIKNIDMVQDVVKQDIAELKMGKYEECEQSLETCITRLNQLTQQIEREAKSFEQFSTLLSIISRDIETRIVTMNDFAYSYEKHHDRFGYEDWSKFISDKKAQLSSLQIKIHEIAIISEEKQTPFSSLLITVKEYEDALVMITKEINTLSDKLHGACLDEDRAIKQSEKLQIIMHEVRVKIRKNHLPSIGAAYEADMERGYKQIESIKALLNETPLNIDALNATLSVAIENIYRLFNNVNNLIGTAKMVENALLYGNKYRSTYPEVDSELTRAELCFRNGEYTQALTIAIQMIEKIHPGSYERLIKTERQMEIN